MIQRTFCHIRGIGPKKERLLWKRGVFTWKDLSHTLTNGTVPGDLLRRGNSRQDGLFPHHVYVASRQAEEWLATLEQSFRALEKKDYGFFLSRLPPYEHWRVLVDCLDEAVFLDIETTGLSKVFHYVTVIGALLKGKFYQWVWPEPLHEFWKLVSEAPVVVTFNGRRFDIPFLEAHFKDFPSPKAHIDLLYPVRKLGIRGGQKAAEEHFGLTRDDEVKHVSGMLAVALWAQSLYGNSRAYRALLKYNRFDVEMMPRVALRVCEEFARQIPLPSGRDLSPLEGRTRCFHRPAGYRAIRSSWQQRQPGLHLLGPKLQRKYGYSPTIVGIDLRGNPKRPTGLAICRAEQTETRIVYTDEEIIQATVEAQPDLISIDAPLSLPRGRQSVSDDSPCRKTGGIVREAERVLWARRIPVYPSLIRHMQNLTKRGIELTQKFREAGLGVIESYPGAAQDVLGIPRKGVDPSLLWRGLSEFGFRMHTKLTHDELDAITSALVGYLFLAEEYEAIGADDEGYMIIPARTSAMRWDGTNPSEGSRPRALCLAGLPGSGKTTLARRLSQALRCKALILGQELRAKASADSSLKQSLGEGKLAPEELVHDMIREAARTHREETIIVDGFPRHPAQVKLADEFFSEWRLLVLNVGLSTAATRIKLRLTCENCGWVGSTVPEKKTLCPVCNGDSVTSRAEDRRRTLTRRVKEAQGRLDELLSSVESRRIETIEADGPLDEVVEDALERIGRLSFTP